LLQLEPLHTTWHHFWQWHPLGHSHGHGHGSDGAIAIAIAMDSHGFLVSQKKERHGGLSLGTSFQGIICFTWNITSGNGIPWAIAMDRDMDMEAMEQY